MLLNLFLIKETQGANVSKDPNFLNCGIRNGSDFQDFGIKFQVRYTVSKIGVNEYVFEAWMACLRPKSSNVDPPAHAFLLNFLLRIRISLADLPFISNLEGYRPD